MCLFATSKGIKIGIHSQEKSEVSNIKGTVNHPVELKMQPPLRYFLLGQSFPCIRHLWMVPFADVARRRRQMYRKRMGPCLASLKPLILAANFPTFFMCVASCLTCEWQISRGGLQWRALNESWERGIISTGAPFFEEPLPSSIFPFAKLETERKGN